MLDLSHETTPVPFAQNFPKRHVCDQISGTFTRCGFANPIQTKSAKHLQELLTNPVGQTIMTTIQKFQDFTDDLGSLHEDRRSAPRAGSIPYFLSYFWQIQEPDLWPVYYTSSVNSLNDLGIWSPAREIVKDYQEYYSLCFELVDLVEEKYSENISLWDIEHLFWFYMQLEDESIKEVEDSPIKPKQPVELKGIPESG